LCISTLERELGASPSEATLEVFDELIAVSQAPVEAGGLVGRAQERAWLTQLVNSKSFGLLTGEAGSGKTVLLREILPEYPVWLECRANDVSLPFASVLRAIRKRLRVTRHLPDWARLELSRLMP
jgi:AAA ATPase domain